MEPLGRRSFLLLCAFCAAAAGLGSAQTSTTGVISGAVTDISGAVVPGASVEVENLGTGVRQKQVTNASGQYVFSNLAPGQYRLTAMQDGFRTATLPEIRVEVTKAYAHNFILEVGQLTEQVEVVATQEGLQIADSTVGNVLAGKSLLLLPTFTRQANELLIVQPGVSPQGSVTGSRRDQNAFTLDGIDVSNNWGDPGTFGYLGLESVEEFRVGVANPNASFARAAGGQVSIITRRGSNELHGALFWYHQNDNLNANSWTNNRNRIREAELKDNRFGFRVGGPIRRNRTFFFLNHDARRFPRSTEFSRLVPTDSLRQGILRFRDAAGSINSYPLATSRACGVGGADPCDPRGLGLSPAMSNLWSQLPPANDLSQGDGLNTVGYQGTARSFVNVNFIHGRIDHHLNDNWRIEASARYYRELARDATQLSIANGNPSALRDTPIRQNFENIALNGIITPSLTAEFRFGRARQRWTWDTLRPSQAAAQLGIPGTNTPDGFVAIDAGALGGTQNLLAEPIDLGRLAARAKLWDLTNYQWNADLNWIAGNHTVQFGSHIRNLPARQTSDDKGNALTSLIATIDADLGALRLPGSVQPPPCGPNRQSNCLLAADSQLYNRLYASALGLTDNVGVLLVRDGNFDPMPFGNVVESDTYGTWNPEFYVQDVWRVRPSLTVTVGLNYSFQTPPKERLGRFTIASFADTGAFVNAGDFLNAKRIAAERGQILNPNFGFVPVGAAGREVFDVDWGNIGPRAGMAWNPSFTSGLLGKVFGDHKTVIRGGFGIVYDRINSIQSVLLPSLGVGPGQALAANVPPCSATGSGGPGCDPSSSNPAVSVFRAGQDGVMPRPEIPPKSIPMVPLACTTGNASCLFPDQSSVQVDPSIKNGRNYGIDLSWQRELPRDMVLETAFVGRFARRLQQSVSLSQAPIMQLDPGSGQTFAQAFDNVATALRAGRNVDPQPWFENQVPGGTAALTAAARSNFINGDVNSVFLAADLRRMSAGMEAFNNYQSRRLALRASVGESNYTALLVTLRKRMSYGLVYDLNYTFSRSLDQVGTLQNSGGMVPNSFDLDAEYGPSDFDLTHMFNSRWLYELPFRSSSRALNRFFGGWHVSGVFTARSGAPLIVQQGEQVWGGGFTSVSPIGAIPTSDPSSFGSGVNRGVVGSGGTGVTSDPAAGGSGLNLFANPEGVFSSFRSVLISRDGRSGRANPIRGLPFWNLDLSIGKQTRVSEKVGFLISADFFNVFNNVNFANPSMSLTNRRGFGVITNQFVPSDRIAGSRAIQLALRVEF
ncbi:MAG: TonB-dependent receptor [Bryobacteraceae bacterium]|nr:TonB-dependent receptor [Bryobacteraceae bacterium]